ncbi:hypothetical protein B0H13DRAFT_2345405 [Mycena leptocephala]|nr:hypothetical protein B0H13DRAFT_2345405 [Mycena leptocephala]
MKFSAIAVTVLSAVALVHAAGTYSITAYTSDFCASDSTVVELVSGPTSSTCISFAGGRSLNLTMTGSCNRMTAWGGSNCASGVGGPFPTTLSAEAPGMRAARHSTRMGLSSHSTRSKFSVRGNRWEMEEQTLCTVDLGYSSPGNSHCCTHVLRT